MAIISCFLYRAGAPFCMERASVCREELEYMLYPAVYNALAHRKEGHHNMKKRNYHPPPTPLRMRNNIPAAAEGSPLLKLAPVALLPQTQPRLKR